MDSAAFYELNVDKRIKLIQIEYLLMGAHFRYNGSLYEKFSVRCAMNLDKRKPVDHILYLRTIGNKFAVIQNKSI